MGSEAAGSRRGGQVASSLESLGSRGPGFRAWHAAPAAAQAVGRGGRPPPAYTGPGGGGRGAAHLAGPSQSWLHGAAAQVWGPADATAPGDHPPPSRDPQPVVLQRLLTSSRRQKRPRPQAFVTTTQFPRLHHTSGLCRAVSPQEPSPASVSGESTKEVLLSVPRQTVMAKRGLR